MDLFSLLRLTIRRWVIVVPVLVITLLALFWLVANRGADYMMRGSYMLVATETLDPTISQLDPMVAADVLDDLLLQPSVRRQLADEGLSPDYTVTIGETGTSLRLAVSGLNELVVLGTADRLIELAPTLLEQSFGESAATIDARPLTEPELDDVTSSGEGGFGVATSIVVAAVPPDSGNPFPATLATVQSLITISDSTDFEDSVATAVPDATFAVTNTNRDAPLIDMTVEAPSGEAARGGYEFVRNELMAQLDQLQDQASVNGPYRTVFQTIVEPNDATPTPSSLVRPAAGIVILGAGLAVALATLVESLALVRRRGDARVESRWSGGRRRQKVAADEVSSPADEPPGTAARVDELAHDEDGVTVEPLSNDAVQRSSYDWSQEIDDVPAPDGAIDAERPADVAVEFEVATSAEPVEGGFTDATVPADVTANDAESTEVATVEDDVTALTVPADDPATNAETIDVAAAAVSDASVVDTNTAARGNGDVAVAVNDSDAVDTNTASGGNGDVAVDGRPAGGVGTTSTDPDVVVRRKRAPRRPARPRR